jgi:prolyl-tRNA synthetase
MVIRPYGYAVWEGIQKFMDPRIKEKGVENAYFPIFIPHALLEKEKSHIKGFSPELAVVTHAGGEKLSDPVVVRPTSETVMYEMYKKWTTSYRDFPILINQWNNVVRWEKRTYLFLRTSEFLWQEGHCAHITAQENIDTVLWAMDLYTKTYQDLLALHGVAGLKSETEKFAGADKTYTYEMLMPDGKALQGCTSHDLGQNFSKGFDWSVQDHEGKPLYPYQNSWGYSTRAIGGLILSHGDDNGLIMPPMIAPVQVVIIPIKADETVNAFIKDLAKDLRDLSIRVKVDDRETKTPGWKFNEWEVKGVPLRIEIGPKELEGAELSIYRRDKNARLKVQKAKLVEEIKTLLNDIQKTLLEKHKKFTGIFFISGYVMFTTCIWIIDR